METLTDEIRTARKQHRCNWCGNPIQKGEKYRHCVNADGSYLWHFKEHLKCNQIFEAFYKVDHPYHEECTAEYFEEEAQEELRKHVCPSCPLWTKTENYYGKCNSPHKWCDCIDKLYAALVMEGRIKEAEIDRDYNAVLNTLAEGTRILSGAGAAFEVKQKGGEAVA